MATPKKHIEPTADLIRKYLAGELDDKTMHALERQALEDPFLAEALEGYGKSPRDREPVLNDLRARLQERASQPAAPTGVVRRIDRRWLAAASILLLISISALFLIRRGPAVKDVAQELPAPKPKDTIVQPLPPVAPQQAEASQPVVNNSAADVKREADAATKAKVAPGIKGNAARQRAKEYEETVVADVQRAEQAPAAVAAAPPPPPQEKVMIRGTGVPPANRTFNADTIFIGSKPSPLAKKNAQAEEAAKLMQGKVAGAESKYPSHHEAHDLRLISGKVLDASTGELMGGAIVHERFSNKRVMTDSTGKFTLSVKAAAQTSIDVSMLGYERTVVNVPADKNTLDIYLPSDNNSLSESVIVAGYGRPAPRPALGQSAYRSYLEALPPVAVAGLKEPVEGEVRVTFTVHSDSTLRNVKANKPFHPAAGDAAVKRVKEGPGWLPVKGRKGKAEILVPVKLIPRP